MSVRITVIAPIVARYDAISSAAVDNFRLLGAEPGWDVALLTSHNELDIPAKVVSGVAELLDDAAFRNADILLYHFGIYHPFIDALLVGNGHARQIAVFHNITPREFVSPSGWPTIEKSLRQAHNLCGADEIWADSVVNAEAVEQFGVDRARVREMPLAVSRPNFGRLSDKLGGRLEFLFVGRIVAAKGVSDLIEAIIRARCAIAAPFHVSIAGNAAFSDATYIAECKARIIDASLEDTIELIETPTDDILCKLYERAHVLCIPSYHEGFCVPVVEGLRAGCIPVGYAAGNVPNVANRLGRLVKSGDIAGLADALVDVSRGLVAASRNPSSACLPLDRGTVTVQDFDRAARAHAETFDFAKVAADKIDRVRRLLTHVERNRAFVPVVEAVPSRPPRGRIVGVFNRLTRAPEWLKRLLRPSFVAVVNFGSRIPGMRRAVAAVRWRLPGPYQWFADRYNAFRPHNEPKRREPVPLMLATVETDHSRPACITPSEDLSEDERRCFTCIIVAANARRRRIPW